MALNTPYRRINPNSINYAAVGQKDPWFALGYALGEGYWNNYNARGEAKATETTKQGLDNFLKYGNVDGPVLGDDEMLSKYARPDKKQQAIDAAIQLPELKPAGESKEGKSKGGNAGQPTFDHALLKWGYTQDKYKDSPNPVGDSISAQKLLNGTEIALNNTNMGAFDENAFKLAIMDKLTKDGRSPQQREAAWAAIQPMIANKKAEYNGKVVNELYGLYEQANMNQDYSNARRFALEINKLDPNLGKHLLSSTVTQKDIWEQQNKERMLDRRLSGGSNKGNNRYTLNSTNKADLEQANKILENRDNYSKESIDWAEKIQSRVNRWGVDGLDLNNASDVTNYLHRVWEEAKADTSGAGKQVVAARILEDDDFLAKHPYAEDVVRMFREENGIPLYLPSDFGANGAWMSSGENEDYNLPSEEVGVFTPIEDKPKTKLTVEPRKDSVVQAGKELSTKYSQDNGLWNVAKLFADWDVERKKK